MLSILTGLLGVLIGLFLGNRLALGRDKRKEFNEIANPLFENLENQRLTILLDRNYPPQANGLTEKSFIMLKRKLSKYKHKSFDKAVKNYEESKHNCGSYDDKGEFKFSNPEVLKKSIEKLQRFLPYK